MQVQDLSYLTDAMGPGHFSQRFKSLTEGLCGVRPLRIPA